jgi:hypothetical protein
MIYHVETKTDFLFFEAEDKKSIIEYCNKNRLKINVITKFDQTKYEDLLFVGFIQEAIHV